MCVKYVEKFDAERELKKRRDNIFPKLSPWRISRKKILVLVTVQQLQHDK